ncbi:OprO/OprP family phosphate-selective porin [Paraglaciecola sp.]|uniref:OprO/OprP family phosphate-selective porin n=1 Tax=Paraglaciecola sp. TaxID=1920173 RepID=UPI003EF12C1E
MSRYIVFASALVALCNSHFATSKDSDLNWQVDHRLMIDGDYLKDWYNIDEFNSEVRRFQTSIKWSNQSWLVKTKIDWDIENKEVEFDDYYIRYQGWDGAHLTLGKHKEPFGLEYSTGSKKLSTIERSMATQAFSPGRNTGFSLNNTGNKLNWWLGAYNNDSYDADSFAVTGRTTFEIFNLTDNILHIGGSISHRNLDGYRGDIKSNAEIYTSENVLNTKKYEIDTLDLMGIEAQWASGPVKLASEWFLQKLSLAETAQQPYESVTHQGGYLQAGFLFGGEMYKVKKNKLASPKLAKNTNIFELVGRLSYLDTTESDIGQEIQNALLGLNFYKGKNLKLMLGYTYSETLSTENQDGNAISLRAQYLF